MSVTDERSTRWSLDKRIPVPLILAIGGQIAVFGWFASSMNSRIESLEDYVKEAKATQIAAVSIERNRDDRLIRLETLSEGIQRSVSNIERKLDDTRTAPRER